ncbi:hypothetical protein SG34_020565 [Thalassomonas viridans]|uniref:Uncharacterized protein n=1 Tax=Thalassomonas viridans TaxID=137584 RepID=A0AAE9YZE5_9GAMM|nr:hypothetical protein [Thalassomonas viridans]WDE03753.1 hypothetical protein SG34_020565 [Thalassomonas viridans]
MKKSLLFMLLLFSFHGYANTYYSLGTDKEVLGAGFEESLTMPLDNCLDGDWVYQGGSQGQLSYQGGYESDTMINTIAGSVKGGVNLVIFGGSVKFSMRRKVTKNSSSAASVIELNYNKGSYNFENRKTKDEVTNLLATDPVAARNKCGDSFIHNVQLGSNLYVTAKIHFNSRSEYEWYQTKIKVKFLFFSKTFTKTKEFYDATKNAVYSIQVNTDGGMTPKLAQLTQGGTTKYCKTDNMDACIDYAESIFNYLLDGGDYTTDLTDDYLKPIKFDTASYEKSGHYDLAYAGASSYSQRYRELSERLRVYQDFVNDEIENINAFLAVAETDEQKAPLITRLAEREQQKISLSDAGDYCYTLPGTSLCEQRIEAAIATVN